MAMGQTVIATWILGVLEQFAALGIDVSDLAEDGWLREAPRLAPTRQLHRVLVQRLWYRAARRSADPLVGLRVGEALPLQTMNVLALIVMHSATLRQGLASSIGYQQLVSNSGRFRTQPTAGGLRLAYLVAPGPVPMHPAQVDSVFAGFWSLVRRCGPPGLRPLRAALPGAVADPAPYEAFFGCPVQLGAKLACMDFSDAMLDRPIRASDPALLRLAVERADALLDDQGRSDALVSQVEGAVSAMGFVGVACSAVAAELGMSMRSLQRRLAECGATYRRVVEAARMHEALRLLGDSRLPLAKISERLGFSEPSAFSHAVSSYWGAAPRDLRREFRAGILDPSMESRSSPGNKDRGNGTALHPLHDSVVSISKISRIRRAC